MMNTIKGDSMMNTKLRQSLALAIGVCVSAVVWAADDGVELKSETDMTSYALGYQIGGDLQRQKMDLNAAAVVRGIADAREGTAPLMTEQSMRTTLIELKRKIVAQERAAMPQVVTTPQIEQQLDKSAGAAAAPDTTQAVSPNSVAPAHARRAGAKTTAGAKEFFQKNAKRQDVVTLPSGVQYRVLKGGTGKQPEATDKVALIYHGTLANGNEFGNTEQDGKSAPKLFPVASLVPGMRDAVSHMKEGAQWQVFVPPELGFDASTPLYRKITVFDVKLVAVNP